MTIEELKAKAHSLPLKPGVYLMLDRRGTVIYVGKAKALRNRVSQYFYELASHGPKTRAMVSQIDRFDVIVVNTELEALVLECAQIKLYQPKYNILLKDDKGYPYIRVDVKAAYPRFSLTRSTAEDGARYFGPFGSRGNSHQIIEAICRALQLPTCSRSFPRDMGKERPCLNQRMGQCLGWCQGGQWDQAAYRERLEQALRLLEGKYDQLLRELEEEMLRAAQELRFEQAAQLRDRSRALSLLGGHQRVAAALRTETDVLGFYLGTAKSCFAVLHYAGGDLVAKDMELLETPTEATAQELLAAVLPQYYQSRGNLPRQLLLPLEPEGAEELSDWLSQRAGRRVQLLTPRRGAKAELIALANSNAREEAERQTGKEERQNKTLALLGHIMGLSQPPERLEAYDISNTGSADIVASMVVFVRGRPLKRDYRRFALRGMSHADDYAAMEQILTRRFQRYLAGDQGFAQLPSALLIDGGVTHAAVAVRVLQQLELQLPVFGMVKDDRHRTRALVTPDGGELSIGQYPTVFALVGQIQEETHRFAITYHHEKHGRSSLNSRLEGIPGLGEKRRAALFRAFKSLRAIQAASPQELGTVLPKNVAQAVYQQLHGHEQEKEHRGETP